MIEDDLFMSELVLTKLSQYGCIPYSDNTGAGAIESAKQYRPNVIILDLMLPAVSGESILETLKNDPELKSIPVIVFSNKSDEQHIEEVLAAGATEYLVKASTEINDLPAIVQCILKK